MMECEHCGMDLDELGDEFDVPVHPRREHAIERCFAVLKKENSVLRHLVQVTENSWKASNELLSRDRDRLLAKVEKAADEHKLLQELLRVVEEKDSRGEPVIGSDHTEALNWLLEFAEDVRAVMGPKS